MQKRHLPLEILGGNTKATKTRAPRRRLCDLVVGQYGDRGVAFDCWVHDGQRYAKKANLKQNNIVLVLPHGSLALQRYRLANEFTQTRQMLAFFIQKQFNNFG